jgi:hypothetical protein
MDGNSTSYVVRTMQWAVYPARESSWMSDFMTSIEVQDEGAGEFLVLKQPFAAKELSDGGIAITPEEWPTLRAAIEAAFAEMARHGGDQENPPMPVPMSRS